MSRVSRNQWPLVLVEGELTLRPLRIRDRGAWLSVRRKNREWLNKWEATSPIPEENRNLPTFIEMVQFHSREGRAGRSLSLAIWFNSVLIGQITLGGISYGAYRGGHIGYWISESYANKGLTTRAVRELTRYGLEELRLHRIEINQDLRMRHRNGLLRKPVMSSKEFARATYILTGIGAITSVM